MLKKSIWARLKQRLQQDRRIPIASSAVASCIIILRMAGLFQPWELAALDQLFRLRPPEPIDQRLVIVEINEKDLKQVGQWPIPDGVMATLLQKLNAFEPRAIGLDIYRDLPVPPGHEEFIKAGQTIPNLIGIELLKPEKSLGVAPSPVLNLLKQVGFNNVLIDADGKVRRSFLYAHVNNKLYTSFALQLALIYLKEKGITPRPSRVNPDYLQLGKGVFPTFRSNDGAYVKANATGYQILANFKQPNSFQIVSMVDILANRVQPSLLRDRIVLIGSTALSLQDFFYTPYSSRLNQSAQRISGVELQANFTSAILSAALDGRPLINTWPDLAESLWILVWSWIGACISWQSRLSRKSGLSILLAGAGLLGISYLAFLFGWWIPLIPPLLGLGGSAIAIVTHLAYLEEELKRSKEFLQKVINTIPDPIFVKDKEHRWIILNQAYCKFIGYPLETLLKKSPYDFFPKHEAEVFWQHNEQVFQGGEEQENEEEFTDILGTTYLIATKRSLHKDAAGNIFLVGVIRDITERKRIEEELKQTAAELIRSNAELKLSEDQMRHLAYHDPLTGLPNRKQFYERMIQSLEWSSSNNQVFALLFLDLDGFKQVNDTLGHDMGDLLLRMVAQRLTGCLRGSDTVSRLGGDEFTVILPAISRVQDAARVAEKTLSTLSQAFILNGQTIFLTVSIGISIYPLNGNTVDTLIKNADSAMYRAKEQGRNRFEFF
ncbi:CHASE2 domain-containing protein [Coleofasciculus sp. FACHB-1120]|uniref:CHASE2 domain-containing protein n=1 Tax=Coleofasciculus sp. FACHB-1120 TaxID=2692783 RepID=UPI001688095F|nr:CHASE2 domain-containing protein [Coleofasciculus sp. FACHB-1120]MBD2740957.1 CHASE2 domain-containing protein [Coleofasciculus sp. FACHB-1120]